MTVRLSRTGYVVCETHEHGHRLRIDIGSGYRVYYGKHGQTLAILLCGGDKRSQQTDIAHATAYWADWKRRNS